METFLEGKTILITGGTGFLGRAIAQRLLQYNPKAIRIFSRDEVKHYKMQEKLSDIYKGVVKHFVGDVRDSARVNKAIRGADIVIHAAALKRIDMIEYNVEEAIKTNVLGTINIINACLENNVEKAIFTSSDKACSPINSYGATKMLGERIFTESNYSKGCARTKFLCTRYGNVISSTGSVIPYFIERLRNNQPIPLTDKNMTRFIITIDQAVDEIIKAIEFGVGGEIFVPKLASLKITDLIDILKIHLGANPQIKIIGIRPGEKIDEELINKDESRRAYELNNSYIIPSRIEEYQDVSYAYLKKGKKVDFSTYNSRDYLMTKQEASAFLSRELERYKN